MTAFEDVCTRTVREMHGVVRVVLCVICVLVSSVDFVYGFKTIFELFELCSNEGLLFEWFICFWGLISKSYKLLKR